MQISDIRGNRTFSTAKPIQRSLRMSVEEFYRECRDFQGQRLTVMRTARVRHEDACRLRHRQVQSCRATELVEWGRRPREHSPRSLRPEVGAGPECVEGELAREL